MTGKINLKPADYRKLADNNGTEPLPSKLYNSKINKKTFGIFNQLKGLLNSECASTKSTQFLTGNFISYNIFRSKEQST
jgi:hypothetical protein